MATNREKYINNASNKKSENMNIKATSTKEGCVDKDCKKCEHYYECYAIVMGVALGVG